MEDDKKKLSIVVPVYGSANILCELIEQLENVLVGCMKLTDYEVILVCDNSPDDSWNIINRLVDSHKNIFGILLRINAGQHNAIMSGLEHATGEIIITMDDDLQHSPADIPKIIKKLEQGHDVVYARFRNRQHAFWKILGSKINNLVSGYLMKKPRDLYLSPFRALNQNIRDEILKYKGPYVYIDGLILTVTRNIDSIDVNHFERFDGGSGYGLRKSISLWLKMATSFSIFPLRLTSFLGMLFSGLGFVLAFLLIIQKLTLNLMPTGWSSLIVTILVVGGIQLLALGMIGEYLGRVLLTINARPQYVVAKVIGGTKDQKVSDEERKTS